MAERLQRKCMDISYQCDDPVIEELASRAVTIAHMKAIVLYIANGCCWDDSIDQFCEWSLDYDLAYLPANFTRQDLASLRLKVGMSVVLEKTSLSRPLSPRQTAVDFFFAEKLCRFKQLL